MAALLAEMTTGRESVFASLDRVDRAAFRSTSERPMRSPEPELRRLYLEEESPFDGGSSARPPIDRAVQTAEQSGSLSPSRGSSGPCTPQPEHRESVSQRRVPHSSDGPSLPDLRRETPVSFDEQRSSSRSSVYISRALLGDKGAGGFSKNEHPLPRHGTRDGKPLGVAPSRSVSFVSQTARFSSDMKYTPRQQGEERPAQKAMSWYVLRAFVCVLLVILTVYVSVATLASLVMILHNRQTAMIATEDAVRTLPYMCTSCEPNKSLSVCDTCRPASSLIDVGGLRTRAETVCREVHSIAFAPFIGDHPFLFVHFVETLLWASDFIFLFSFVCFVVALVAAMLNVGVYRFMLARRDRIDFDSIRDVTEARRMAFQMKNSPKRE